MGCLNGLAFNVENPQGHFQLSFTPPPLFFPLSYDITEEIDNYDSDDSGRSSPNIGGFGVLLSFCSFK